MSREIPVVALALLLGDPLSPGGPARTIRTGADADLCLIDRPWEDARKDLGAVGVVMTFRFGQIVWRR